MKKRIFQVLVILLLSIFVLSACESNKKYKVTSEQWEALAKEYNYTLELIGNGVSVSIQKYTKDSSEIDGSIIFIADGKEYSLSWLDDVWVAIEGQYDMWLGGLIEAYEYNEFEFDKESKMYICDKYANEGYIYKLKFENGVLISKIVENVLESGNEAVNLSYEIRYSNIGTTEIVIPEYISYEEYESRFTRTVTEEQWNDYADEMNFSLECLILRNGEYQSYKQKTTSEAYEKDGKIIISKDGKKYMLEQNENVWLAKEVENIELFERPLLKDLNFNDFEYNEEEKQYVQKNIEGKDFKYIVKFSNGVPEMIGIESLNDSNDLMIYYILSEIGTTVIEVPNYTFE